MLTTVILAGAALAVVQRGVAHGIQSVRHIRVQHEVALAAKREQLLQRVAAALVDPPRPVPPLEDTLATPTPLLSTAESSSDPSKTADPTEIATQGLPAPVVRNRFVKYTKTSTGSLLVTRQSTRVGDKESRVRYTTVFFPSKTATA